MTAEVFVFGDSIAMGLWDGHGSRPAQLWEGHSRIIYNLGVDGNTSEDVKTRFSQEAKARGANKNSMIVFAVGINDSSHMSGANRVSLTNYLTNMEELIDTAKKHFTSKILCVGLSPIDQSKSVPFILAKEISFYTADQIKYDSALKNLCDKKGVKHVSLASHILAKHLSDDGVHPLTSGHEIIAKEVLAAITQPQ